MSTSPNIPQDRYPWLANIPENPKDYHDPTYYDRLLQEYSFDGKSDLELLREHLSTIPSAGRILELGCGSGRATEEIVAALSTSASSIDLVDLSSDMVGYCTEKFKHEPSVRTHHSDSIDFLGQDENYDALVSLWNVSHSIHQHMIRLGREQGAQYVQEKLAGFVADKLQPGGSIYIVHYDIQSPEQRLINPWRLKLWETADPTYDASTQSPSKDLLDETFSALQGAGYLKFNVSHLAGDPIIYPSAEAALETFLNFHMEGYFNDRPELPEVIESLLEAFKQYTDSEGILRIAPGAFVYTAARA